MRDQLDEELRKTADHIRLEAERLPEGYDEFVEEVLAGLPERKGGRRITWKGAVVLAAALTAALSVTVSAAVNYALQRMEAMEEEEVLDYYAESLNYAPSDFYSRELTDEELARMERLTAAYAGEGVFPEGGLRRILDASEYAGEGVAFLASKSTFFLPGELSDEELLQIIDFRAKREYSLQDAAKQAQAGNTEALDSVRKPQEKEVAVSGRELMIECDWEFQVRHAAAAGDTVYVGSARQLYRMDSNTGELTLMEVRPPEEKEFSWMAADAQGRLCVIVGGKPFGGDDEAQLWTVTPEGEVIGRFDVEMPQAIAADGNGRIYLARRQGPGEDQKVDIYEADGTPVRTVGDMDGAVRSLGRGKDGRVYGVLMEGEDWIPSVIAFDPIEGETAEKYQDVLPSAGAFNAVSAGTSSDLLIWGPGGVYSYNLGDEKGECIHPVYELPDSGVLCFTPDGRAMFVKDEMEEGAESFETAEIRTKRLYLLKAD